MNISLKGPEDALEFVRRVEKYPYTMDLCCGSIVVDDKIDSGDFVPGI